MTNKIWTAVGLELGKLTILPAGDALSVERRYKFLNSEGEVLTQITGGRVSETIPIAEIPANILNALQAIDNWTKQKALEQEEMA